MITKILFLSTLAFVVAILWTPLLTKFLYKYKLGKKIRNDGTTPIFSQLHAKKSGTPTMGGVLMWVTTLVLALLFYWISVWWPDGFIGKLNFLNRSETWLPLGVLVASALVGLVDDWLDVRGKGTLGGGGLNIKHRLLIYTLIALVGAWWFYFKLDRNMISIPFWETITLGWWYIPTFVLVIVATAFSVNETDGLDGLAGGVLLTSFSAYTVIAFMMGKYDLAVFCAVIVGTLSAFLWFNISPARFYMGDTGSMSLGITLGIIAMLTDTPFILIIIGSVFVLESLSVLIQITSKRLRHGQKIFRSAPIHHHFEAIGWPETKIVMRFWVIAGMSAALGLTIFLLNRALN